jgi:uncharacterized protein (DUF169 family)
MDTALQERFIGLWTKYFDGSPLPIVSFYTDQEDAAPKAKPPTAHRCVVADISRVRSGRSLSFDVGSIGCFGGKKYLGYAEGFRPNFEYFLSCGIPGQMEGERYKKSPELVKEVVKALPKFEAPSRYIVFKRWDKVAKDDDPQVVIFFGTPDIISGLFTLANFDVAESNGVFCPFGAGCATIVLYPFLEQSSSHPRGVLGMFDVSARPCVSADVFTFAVPMNRFAEMVENMEESFLITGSWGKVKKRIASNTK